MRFYEQLTNRQIIKLSNYQITVAASYTTEQYSQALNKQHHKSTHDQ